MSGPCGCDACEPRIPCASPSCVADGINRYRLSTLSFRMSAYDATFERMRFRLSGADLPALRALTARALDESIDPAMALLDGWACLSELLSFYNERIVNEHYLNTCTERRSALELARLVGYAPRPGVSADVYLAYILDDINRNAALEIPLGTRAYSQPGPGETMQPFETSEALGGRPRWSAMHPRLTEPQRIGPRTFDLSFKGITTGLATGDVLLFELGKGKIGRSVASVEPLPKEDRTVVTLQTREGQQPEVVTAVDINSEILGELVRKPALYTGSKARLDLDPSAIFSKDAYAPLTLLGAAYPALHANLDAALGGTTPSGATGAATIYAMRVKAALHGHNAQLIAPDFVDGRFIGGYREWSITGTDLLHTVDDANEDDDERRERFSQEVETLIKSRTITLDAVYDKIVPGSLVAIVRPTPTNERLRRRARTDRSTDRQTLVEVFGDDDVFTVDKVATISTVEFNLPSRVTQLTLDRIWLDQEDGWTDLRKVVVYAQSEPLELAEHRIEEPVGDDLIELDDYYDGLQPGRRLIVSGERADLSGVTGVQTAELVMIAAVTHRTSLDRRQSATTDTIHTWVTLAEPLQYRYARPSVTIHGNVAHATHGERRVEVLGSGDASRPLQTFALKQVPLTYVSAPTASGVANTLEVQVNDLRWREAPNAAAIFPGQRSYLLRTEDEGATSVIFGMGNRLPTGRDNVRAVYRSGIGAGGNVQAGQVSVLASRPNGVMAVTNPLASSGGADRDGLSQIRRRTPIGLSALDRLVSASDFEDFTRAFAGIGKASVVTSGTTLTLVIAGENDAPIAAESALLANLEEVLIRFGDLIRDGSTLRTRGTPSIQVSIERRKGLLLVISARIAPLPDYVWEAVQPRVEAALYGMFGFEGRDIGQDADPGAAIAVMQGVRGVDFVDLNVFGAIDPGTSDKPKTPTTIATDVRKLFTSAPGTAGMPPIVGVDSGELAYLARGAAGTLLLNLYTEEAEA